MEEWWAQLISTIVAVFNNSNEEEEDFITEWLLSRVSSADVLDSFTASTDL